MTPGERKCNISQDNFDFYRLDVKAIPDPFSTYSTLQEAPLNERGPSHQFPSPFEGSQQ